MPIIIGTDDFGHNDFTVPGGGPYAAVSGTPQRDVAITHPGDPYSLLVSSTANVTYDNPTNPTKGWIGFWWYQVSTDPFVGSHGLDIIFPAAGGSSNTGWASAPSRIFHTVGTAFPSRNVALDAWHWIEHILDVGSGTRTSYCRVDNIDLASDSAAVAASTIDSHVIGDNSTTNTQRFAHVMWGYATSITDWLGYPDSVGYPITAPTTGGRGW
jgi:hypothetical protein